MPHVYDNFGGRSVEELLKLDVPAPDAPTAVWACWMNRTRPPETGKWTAVRSPRGQLTVRSDHFAATCTPQGWTGAASTPLLIAPAMGQEHPEERTFVRRMDYVEDPSPWPAILRALDTLIDDLWIALDTPDPFYGAMTLEFEGERLDRTDQLEAITNLAQARGFAPEGEQTLVAWLAEHLELPAP